MPKTNRIGRRYRRNGSRSPRTEGRGAIEKSGRRWRRRAINLPFPAAASTTGKCSAAAVNFSTGYCALRRALHINSRASGFSPKLLKKGDTPESPLLTSGSPSAIGRHKKSHSRIDAGLDRGGRWHSHPKRCIDLASRSPPVPVHRGDAAYFVLQPKTLDVAGTSSPKVNSCFASTL